MVQLNLKFINIIYYFQNLKFQKFLSFKVFHRFSVNQILIIIFFLYWKVGTIIAFIAFINFPNFITFFILIFLLLKRLWFEELFSFSFFKWKCFFVSCANNNFFIIFKPQNPFHFFHLFPGNETCFSNFNILYFTTC